MRPAGPAEEEGFAWTGNSPVDWRLCRLPADVSFRRIGRRGRFGVLVVAGQRGFPREGMPRLPARGNPDPPRDTRRKAHRGELHHPADRQTIARMPPDSPKRTFTGSELIPGKIYRVT